MITVSCSTHNRAYMEQARTALATGLAALTKPYCYTFTNCIACPCKTACGDLTRAINFLDSRLYSCKPKDSRN